LNPVAERIKIIRENMGKSQKDMAADLGISLPALQGYEAGKSFPGGKVIESLVKLGFNANWLLTGEGGIKEMASAKPFYKQILSGEVLIGEDYTVREPADVLDDGFVKVPRYKVDASAGHGSVISSEQIVDHLAFRADWVRHALGVQVSALALINVTGDSMEPTLSNGDLILIDTSVGRVDDSGVYVLQFDGKLKVKRIHSKTDGTVDIISDNPRYPIELINNDLVQGLNVVGRVVWCGRRM
jgi:phage repressor protein C with HTH and peptisase S24 domain